MAMTEKQRIARERNFGIRKISCSVGYLKGIYANPQFVEVHREIYTALLYAERALKKARTNNKQKVKELQDAAIRDSK